MGFSSGVPMLADMRLFSMLLMACSSTMGVDMMVAKTAPFAKNAKLEVIAIGFGLAEG